MENEDEEVVFKNSALYDHLMATGCSEFESASCLNPADTRATPPPSSGEKMTVWFEMAADWLGLRPGLLVASQSRDVLLQAGLMNDRDKAMVMDLCPQTQNTSAAALLPTTYLVAAGVCGVASALYLPLSCLPLVLLVAVVAGGATFARYRQSADLRRLQLFCSAAAQFRRTTLKCVRMLQEARLMARGVALSSGERCAEAAFSVQYGQLVEASSACLSASCAAYAASTRRLRGERPLLDGVDPESHYLAYQQPPLVTSPDSPVTVKQVKSLQQLMSELLSELVRRCCMGMMSDLLPTDSCRNGPATDLLSHLTNTLSEQERRLAAAHRAHLARWAEPAQSPPTATAAAGPVHRLYVGVHGVCQQAQVVALLAQTMEDALPAADDEAVPLTGDGPLCSRLRGQLEETSRRLQSAALLCEQTQLQLSRLCDEPAPAALSPPSHAPLAPDPQLVELPEPEIVDQFFEAVVEGDAAPQDDAEEQLFSQEERLERRLQRQRAKELLSELDSALSSKRREWVLREAAARGEPVPPTEEPMESREVMVSPDRRQTPDYIVPVPDSSVIGHNIPDDYKIDPRELYMFSDSDELDGETPVLPPIGDLAHLLPVQRRARPAAGRRPPSRPSSLAAPPPDLAALVPGDAHPVAARPHRPASLAADPGRGGPTAVRPLPLRLGFPADLSAQAAAAAQLRRLRHTASDQQDEEVFGGDSD